MGHEGVTSSISAVRLIVLQPYGRTYEALRLSS
jgi:hypothetical protein